MAEAAAARREARRKRILDNSQNRLQSIAGKTSGDAFQVSPERENICSPYVDSVIPATINEDPIAVIQQAFYGTCHANITRTTTEQATANGILDPFDILNEEKKKVKIPSIWEKLMVSKLDIVLLSLVMQITYSLAVVDINNVYVFLPLALYVATRLMYSPTPPTSGFASMLLLLNSLSSSRVQRLIFIIQLLVTFAQDIFVFLFCTICIQSVLVCLSSLFTT